MNDARAAIRGRLNQAEGELRAREEPEEPLPAPSRPIQKGDLVELRGTKTRATVLSVDKDGKLRLQAGAMQLTIRAEEVRLIEDAEARQKKAARQQMVRVSAGVRSAGAPRELDIRGMETLEAEDVVNRFIDAARLGKLETVSIIHGKGTGALRRAVQATLKRHPGVKNFRLGRYGEGEDGVTIVELK